jgi:phage terminase large subunit
MGLLEQYRFGVSKNTWNKSDLIYKVFGNEVRFAGLEDQEQIKSTEWHDVWVEEAFEFAKKDYIFLKTRLFRGVLNDDQKPRIYMSFNPFDCWIFDLEGHKRVDFIYSNYKDNPFVNEECKLTLEELKDQDEAAYKIYCIGARASYQHIIYKTYVMLKEFPVEFDETIYGIDFGYNNPTALLQINYKDNERYLRGLLYRSKMTNGELIEYLKGLVADGTIKADDYFYADSAEPARITEISNAGFNIYPADKSVADGLDFCKRQKYHTTADNVDCNAERDRYKYKEDRNGNIMDEPVKFKDHYMDCKRYADYTHCAKRIEPNIRFL